ncbi:MAG: carbohydrate ABC transporter permease, partial [Candidatus Bipolaricaulia bacterium]
MIRKLQHASWTRILLYTILVLVALFYLMPVYMTVVTALKHPENISLATSWAPPNPVNWNSFVQAYQKLIPNFTNSLILAVSGTVLSAILGSLNGYVFSKWQFKGHETVFTLLLF